MAQESGQPIIFSVPKTDGAAVPTPSLTTKNSSEVILPDSVMAPVVPSFFAPSEPARLPPPINTAEQRRQRQLQEDRKNWTLMTPEEILGVTASEKLLQPPEKDAFGRDKNPTQMERYLARENSASAGLTNGWRRDRANSPWNFSRDEDSSNPFAVRPDGTADPMQNLNHFLARQQVNDNAFSRPGEISDASVFDAGGEQKATKEKLEQVASMERFRQMLQPTPAASDSQFFPVPKPVVDKNFTQPDFVPNPAGASFTPLSSSVSRPAGLTPLPGIISSHPQPAVTPSWKPQPPPWLSQSPTAFPQQKF